MVNLIEALCNERGVSGDEARVAQLIKRRLDGKLGVEFDRLGNLIATTPAVPAKNKVAVFAHMDEVGMLVTHITEKGYLLFSPIGMEAQILHGRRVLIGDAGLPGVVGAQVWHHLDPEQRKAPVKLEELYIDIGAKDREEAQSMVSVGDCVVVDEAFCRLGESQIAARALDNRIGCAILIKLLAALDCPVTGVFSCGEESSMYGARAAANLVAPDIALILETTTAGDIPGVDDDKAVCRLGGGAVVPFADRASLYDRQLFDLAFETAAACGIPIQTKHGIYGGNEARAVMPAGEGVRVVCISVPCRYLHSSSCIADLGDVDAALSLAAALLPILTRL
jgi:putative aminopeptidase FrvX